MQAPTVAPFLSDGRVIANLYCMASMLIWATGFPAVGMLLPFIPPLPLTALRMTLGVSFLIPLWLFWEGPAALRAANWGKGLLVGGFGFGLGAFLLVYALQITDPVTVAVISAAMPVVGVALECLLDGRRLTAMLILGMALSLIGGLVACVARVDGLGLGLGALLAFVSVFIFCWASRATVAEFSNLSSIGQTTVTMVGAALATVVASVISAAIGQPSVQWAALGWPHLGVLMLYGIGSLALSQLWWIIGVGKLGVGIASMHINAAPFYVMVFVFLLGGAWNQWQAAGAVVVAAGVLVSQIGGKRTREIKG